MTEEKNLMTDEMFQCVGIDEQSSETLVRPSISYWQDAVRRLKKNKVAMISLFFLIFMIFMCIFAPYIYPHAYNAVSYTHLDVYKRQVSAHLL